MAPIEDERLEQYRIKNVPPSMYYIPNFINAEEEEHILHKIPPIKWISLSHRRLQAIPARLTASNSLVASSGLPDWLSKPIGERFRKLALFKNSPHGHANHCLINEYLPGQGIMPHEDGAAYHAVVATVSLGGSVVLDVTKKLDRNDSGATNGDQLEESKAWRIFQEPRSLLVTTGSAYTDTLHGIAGVEEDIDLNEETVTNWDLLAGKEELQSRGGSSTRMTRTSLTYRDVLKVSNIGSKIFGKPKS